MSGSPLNSSLQPALTASDEAVINEGVSVVVRVRPLSTKERADARVHNCIKCLPDCVIIDGSAHARASMHASPAGPASQPTRATTRPYQFSVDQVFNTHASQIEVYEQSCKRIVEGIFHGINGSILAYGATGSGKTHTMFGSTMSAAGIVYQAVQDIFAEKERLEEEEGKRVRIKCSFLEVYNEDVFDLLARPVGEGSGGAKSLASSGAGASGREAKRVPLQVREAPDTTASASAGFDAGEGGGINNGGLHIRGLTHIFPETFEDFARSIEHGHTQRFVAATGANAQSSRSHAIITVEVEVRHSNTCANVGDVGFASAVDDDADAAETATEFSPTKKAAKRKKRPLTSTVTIAKIQFADLAGSERAAATSNTGLRLREGGNINRSLLALGAVVQSLVQQKVRRRQTGGKGGGKIFIPYRGSKLTRLLRDSIGGNCRTQMLFCLSPSTKHTEETVNTMKFAMNAKEIQVEAHRNEFAVNSSQLAKTQEALIEELREELARAQSALAAYTSGLSGNDSNNSSSAEGNQSQRADAVPATESSVVGSESPSLTLHIRQGASPSTSNSPLAALSTGNRSHSSPAPTPSVPALPSWPAKSAPRGTVTPSAAAAGAAASSPSVNGCQSPVSIGGADVLQGGSVPRPSLSSRTARPSVFSETTPLFSELEARLKNFSAQKESLYHEVREAQERQRDRETQLREQQWRLATFLVSDASGSRARGEVDGNGTTGIGVAGLRKMISAMEAEQAQQAHQLTALTERLDDADRQFAATRQELLRERQGTSLELLLDNARLRQGCTEAECLAAHYHQECRSLLNRQAEYAEALSKCVEAIQRLRPHLAQLTSPTSSMNGSNSGNAIVAAVETANVALLYALLPTASTAQMTTVFESALHSTVKSPLQAPPLKSVSAFSFPAQPMPFAHPPLAPSPTNRAGRSNSCSPLRGGGPAGTRGSNHLAEHFRDLMATAESMHLTSSSERDTSENTEGVRTRHGHLVQAADRTSSPERRPSTQQACTSDEPLGRAPATGNKNAPKAFGRTFSLTGLTRNTATAPPGGRKRRLCPVADKTSSSGPVGGHAPRTINGAAAKKSFGGGALRAQALQRSVSAPLPFTRSASRTQGPAAGPARKPKAASASGPAAASLTRRHAGAQNATQHRANRKTPVGSPGAGHTTTASSFAFVRSNHASALRALAFAMDSADSSLRGRSNRRGEVNSSPPTAARAPSLAQAQQERKRTSGGAAPHLLGFAPSSSSKFERTSKKAGKLARSQATFVPVSTPRVAGASGVLLQRRSDSATDTAATFTSAGSPSRISSSSSDSSSLNVSCESAPSRYNVSPEGRTATPETGAHKTKKAANGPRKSHDKTPQLTVARLLECAAAAAPALPQYNATLSPNTHGSDCVNKENGQQPLQSRTRTSFTDDLMVSISTCFSDGLSPNSRGQVSSSHC
ncbi:Kinesin motor domain family protein [Leishmania donovani]|uniref:Kinesin motor domain family protein n=1 Tax=Leishmania donovani TaxID=5661 RepID=A0A504XWG8_LEIDO|nr:Kinesin motor domain family protein [Leishmania donovani]